jgi:hypothetical protein
MSDPLSTDNEERAPTESEVIPLLRSLCVDLGFCLKPVLLGQLMPLLAQCLGCDRTRPSATDPTRPPEHKGQSRIRRSHQTLKVRSSVWLDKQ